MDRIQPFKNAEQLQAFWHEPSDLFDKDTATDSSSTDKKELKRSASNEYVKLNTNTSTNTNLNSKIPTVMVSRAEDDIIISDSDQQNSKTEPSTTFQRSNQLRRSCPPPSRPNRRRSKTPSAYSQRSIKLNPIAPTIKSANVLSSSSNTLVERMQSKINSVKKSWLFSFFERDSSTRSLGKNKWKKADIDFESEFFDRQNELTESLVSRRSPLSMSSSTCGSISGLSSAPQSPTEKETCSARLSPTIKKMTKKNKKHEGNTTFLEGYQPTNSTEDEQQKQQQQQQQQQKQQQQQHGGESSHYSLAGQVRVTNQNNDQPHNHYRNPDLQQHHLLDRSVCHSVDCTGQCFSCNPTSNISNITTLSLKPGQLIQHTKDYHQPQQQQQQQQQKLKTNNNSSLALSTPTNANAFGTFNSDTDDFTQNSQPKQLNQSHQSESVVLRRQNQLSIPTSSNSSSSSISIQRYNRPQSACLDTYMLRMRNGNLLQFTVDEDNKDEECCSIIPSVSDYESAASNINKLDNLHSRAKKSERPLSMISNVINNESSLVNIGAVSTMANIDRQLPQIIDIYWPRHRVSAVTVDINQTAFGLIRQAITSPAPTNFFQDKWKPSVYIHSLALRLICHSSNTNDHQWLHPSQNILQFFQLNHELIDKGWRLEIRIRYVPDNLDRLFHDDIVIFKLLYQQVLADFLSIEFKSDTANDNLDTVIELGCLELRSNNPYFTPQTLDKSSNFDSLDNELHNYFPSTFISFIKTKVLRKLIKREFKKIHALQKRTAIFEFLRLVPKFVDFQKEKFQCSFGDSAWSIPIELIVNAKGISTNAHKEPLLNEFDRIQKIQIQSHATINRMNANDEDSSSAASHSSSLSKKILLNVQIKNEEDMLVISCSSFSMAQSLADLLDGYRRLALNTNESVWINVCENHVKTTSSVNQPESLKNSNIKSEKIEVAFVTPKISSVVVQSYETSERKFKREDSINTGGDEEGDYSNPDEYYRELNRKSLYVGETIGSGQFGDVYKGTYYCNEATSCVGSSSFDNNIKHSSDDECIDVAIKISKIGNSSTGETRSSFEYFTADQKLLGEAQRMKNLEHSNIIRLIGVCSSSPVYVVMELAKYGELRDFLQKHGSTLEHRYLIEYCMQISSALSYLEMKQFVHRDIAARNVLVFSFDCVKLADFGLSRYIEDSSYYMATNSKLPIKWMAPESINFRRFTSASDVWMFAVCMWEIFMLGKKPFLGVKNAEVIGLIETGERLTRPSRCPEMLYELMLKCWKYEPDKRPTFRYIKKSIRNVHQNELGLVGAIARADQSSRESTMSTVSSSNNNRNSVSSSLSSSNVDIKKNDLAFARSSSMNVNKIKAILEEQRRQMDEDSKWLAQNETNWSKNSSQNDSYKSGDIASSSSTSVYEDASVLKFETQYLTPKNMNQSGSSYGEASCNSFKSVASDEAHYSSNTASITTTSSSCDSNTDSSNCNLSVSLKKFFKQNKLVDKKMQKQMMSQVNCTSANVDRSNDTIYQGTIQVVNSVRSMVKGVRQLNPAEIVDLVGDVGSHLRDLMANIDCKLVEMPIECRESIEDQQKKVSSNMNSIVDAMKKTIINADSPMKELHVQNMLEAGYNLIIDTKNLFDMFDEVRIEMQSLQQHTEQLTPAFGDIDVCNERDDEFKNRDEFKKTIYENEDVSSESTITTAGISNVFTTSICPTETTTFHVQLNEKID